MPVGDELDKRLEANRLRFIEGYQATKDHPQRWDYVENPKKPPRGAKVHKSDTKTSARWAK